MPRSLLVLLPSLLLSLLLLAPTAAAREPALVPLPWKDAGFSTSVHPSGLSVRFCTADYQDCFDGSPDPTAGRVVVDAFGVHFEADVVSRVSGNRWEFGLENVVLDAPAGLEYFFVDGGPEARFEVPVHGGQDVRHVAFRAEGTVSQRPQSALGIESVEAFVAGDTVTRRSVINWTVNGMSPGESTTSCNYGPAMPGIVLDDCLAAVEIFLPGHGGGPHR